jgi:hypothetical protein
MYAASGPSYDNPNSTISSTQHTARKEIRLIFVGGEFCGNEELFELGIIGEIISMDVGLS